MSEPDEGLTLDIPEHLDGERLDRALAALIPDRSRALIQRDLAAEAITVNGRLPPRGAKTKVRAEDRVVYVPPPLEPLELVAEPMDLSVLHEDDDLLVIDKPAGLVVHPALGHPNGTLVNGVLHHLGQLEALPGSELRPGIVHRLDRDTTGVIVVAKHPRAHALMADLFKDRKVEKHYVAITKGVPSPPKGTLDTLYGRHPTDRKRFSSRVRQGKRAVTHYEVQQVLTKAARVGVRLETGRTHQIRVHFADLGHPLIGDPVYGRNRGPDAFARTALHARKIAFRHPFTQAEVSFEAPMPKDLLQLLSSLRSDD